MKVMTIKTPNKIIVLQGVPASGKSTWARNIVKDTKDYVIVSRDAIRESRGDYWIPEQEDYISRVEEFQVREALEFGLNVIIDATNLNPKTIAKWQDIANATQSIIEFKLFKIGYKEALERDKNRSRPVGEKVLKQFFRNYFLDDYNKETSRIDTRVIKEPELLPKCIICDLDGTLAIHKSGRSPYDYTRVSEDYCDPRLQQLLQVIYNGYYSHPLKSFKSSPRIIFLSGREGSEQCRQDTINWILKHFDMKTNISLLMRKKGDYRKDSVVKQELYKEYIENNYDVLCVFDDRDSVVKMWRDLGLLTLQVYYGDF